MPNLSEFEEEWPIGPLQVPAAGPTARLKGKVRLAMPNPSELERTEEWWPPPTPPFVSGVRTLPGDQCRRDEHGPIKSGVVFVDAERAAAEYRGCSTMRCERCKELEADNARLAEMANTLADKLAHCAATLGRAAERRQFPVPVLLPAFLEAVDVRCRDAIGWMDMLRNEGFPVPHDSCDPLASLWDLARRARFWHRTFRSLAKVASLSPVPDAVTVNRTPLTPTQEALARIEAAERAQAR